MNQTKKKNLRFCKLSWLQANFTKAMILKSRTIMKLSKDWPLANLLKKRQNANNKIRKGLKKKKWKRLKKTRLIFHQTRLIFHQNRLKFHQTRMNPISQRQRKKKKRNLTLCQSRRTCWVRKWLKNDFKVFIWMWTSTEMMHWCLQVPYLPADSYWRL